MEVAYYMLVFHRAEDSQVIKDWSPKVSATQPDGESAGLHRLRFADHAQLDAEEMAAKLHKDPGVYWLKLLACDGVQADNEYGVGYEELDS